MSERDEQIFTKQDLEGIKTTVFTLFEEVSTPAHLEIRDHKRRFAKKRASLLSQMPGRDSAGLEKNQEIFLSPDLVNQRIEKFKGAKPDAILFAEEEQEQIAHAVYQALDGVNSLPKLIDLAEKRIQEATAYLSDSERGTALRLEEIINPKPHKAIFFSPIFMWSRLNAVKRDTLLKQIVDLSGPNMAVAREIVLDVLKIPEPVFEPTWNRQIEIKLSPTGVDEERIVYIFMRSNDKRE